MLIDDAFHETWYERGRRVRNLFFTFGFGNQMGCRLSAYGIIDMNVPSFTKVSNIIYQFLSITIEKKHPQITLLT